MELLDKKVKPARRKYLKWIFGSAAGISIAGFFIKSRKPKTVKMLTSDGKLVEVPVNKLPGKKRKANLKELKTWIWKHNS